MKPTVCIGFNGKCQNKAGTDWQPYWCINCEEKRTKWNEQFGMILEDFFCDCGSGKFSIDCCQEVSDEQ